MRLLPTATNQRRLQQYYWRRHPVQPGGERQRYVGGTLGVTGTITGASTVQGTQLISTVTTGTAPIVVNSTTMVANLNADQLDGQHGAFYQNASNINSGTLATNYGGTGLNTSTAGNGTLLIGNGSGFTLANLTAGPGINISNTSGGITITAPKPNRYRWR